MGKTFIIAEMSANHNGSKQIGIETIRAAKRAGADAIKLQTYTADTITLDNDKMEFMADSTSVWAGMRLYDLYKQPKITLPRESPTNIPWIPASSCNFAVE